MIRNLFNWFKSVKQEQRPEPTPYEVFETEVDPELEGMSEEHRDWLTHYLITADWVNVSSTNVGAVKYNFEQRSMDVEFREGRYYSYFDVPIQFFVDFMLSASKGSFVWEEIRRPDRLEFVRYSFGGTRPMGDKRIKAL